MAKGILIDVGFVPDVQGLINDLEQQFKNVKFDKVIGISEAFDKQLVDVRDKIENLKKEIAEIGKGHGIDVNFKNQFEDMNKSIRVLQNSIKALIDTAPKSKQAGLVSQLEQINQSVNATAEVTKNTAKAVSDFQDAKFVNNKQLNELKELYIHIERARQASENFDKTRKQTGNKPYIDTDTIMNDIRAVNEVYAKLNQEYDNLSKSKKANKDGLLAFNNADLMTQITQIHRLILTLEDLTDVPLASFKVDKMGILNLGRLKQTVEDQYEDILQNISNYKAKIQAEYSKLGGDATDLDDYFKKATSKARERGITVPVYVAPGAKESLLTKCNEIIKDINAKLTDTPIQVEVQLVTAYQSKRNTALIQDLQKQIVAMEENARNSVANGASEAQAARWTEISKDMEALLTRLNKQINNAMMFTVEVNTSTAISTVNAFIEEVKEKLPKIKPDMELSASAKRSFKAQVNSFIKELNKEIAKIQVEKDKMNNDVFSSYVKQLTNTINLLKEFATTLNKGDFINIEEKTKQLQSFKETFDRNVAGIQLELINAFDPEKNNLGLWSNTLLSTLQTALVQIQKLSEYKVFQIDDTPTKQAATDMVKDAETSTADAQQSHSPSKVAEQLGKYWGDGYAEGILNSKTKVQNAIRALVEAGKLTALDLANDTSAEADYVSGKLANGVNPTSQAKRYQKIIAEFDRYQKIVQDTLKLKLPTDETTRNNVLEVQKKNLEDIRQGAIDAQKAIYNLRDAFGGSFNNKEQLQTKQEVVKTNEQQTKQEVIDKTKEETQTIQQASLSAEKANEQIAKSEEKPIAKTQQLIEQFKTLHQLIQDAFENKDLSLITKYFTELQNVNAQMGKSHIKGAKDRNSIIQGYQNAIDSYKVDNAQTQAVQQRTEAIKISKQEQEALTRAEHEFVDSIRTAENDALNANTQSLQQKTEAIKVSKAEQEAFTAAEHEFINSIANEENNVLSTNIKAIEQKTQQGRISKQQQEALTQSEHELINSLREEQNAILGINEQTEQEIKAQEKLNNTKNKQKSKQSDNTVQAINNKTDAIEKERSVVTSAVQEEINKFKELESVIKNDIPNAIKDKNSAFNTEKSIVKNAVNNEIKNIKELNKQAEKEAKAKEEEKALARATKSLNKNYEQIQTGFTNELAKNNRTLVEASFQPTKKGLIEINALIKEADDTYKSFVYTTKTGKAFDIVKEKQGLSVEKQGAVYEKWIKLQEQLKNPKMIGDIEPNTAAWEQLVELGKQFGLEMKDIVKIVRNVDHGIESFQFFDKAGNRTTLGINSDMVLYEKNPIIKISEDVDNFKKKIADLPKIIRDGITNYDANAGAKYIDALNEIANLWQKINQYRQMGNLSKSEIGTLDGLFTGSAKTIDDTLLAKLPTEGRIPQIVSDVNDLRQAFQTLFQNIYTGNYSIEGSEDKLNEYINKAKELYQVINSDTSKVAKPTSIDKLLSNIGDELNRNTKMSNRFREQLNALVSEIQKIGYAMPNDKLKAFQAQFQSIRSQIHLAGQTGRGFFDQLSTSLGRSIIQFTNMYLSLYRVISYIRKGVTEVTNLDKALTTMSYTMKVNNAQIKEMSNDIVNMAKDLSISVDNVSKIYQIYANMQTTTEEMMQTARPTAILANLSGVDASTAADQIQGVLNQFNLLAEESEHIVDVYDYISANISVDYSKGIAGMADAVKNVGNVAYEAGLSFEQLGAIIGKVMAKTRQDGASIGNALRTIAVRISKANKLAGDEVDNATVGNAAKALHNIGIEVYTTSGEFRELDTIMTELAAKWDDLSDAEQANISFQIAATRQMFASVYSNMHKRIYLIAGNA